MPRLSATDRRSARSAVTSIISAESSRSADGAPEGDGEVVGGPAESEFIQDDVDTVHAPQGVWRRALHHKKRRCIMKTILITAALGAVIVAPAPAQQPPQSQTRQGWDSRVHLYAPDHYVPQHGNSNTNPDFQLTRER
jgi:hypothetical protein